ncbi:MAG: hypothetical protein MR874_03075 [Coriobacteriaceae bacterium]|uniref:hypothetical protein n=1 Tax=Tractidigestivibacter sp. TaxID=2847320 RepID=UPI002A804F14|nr:hypothetical protein [Tractidigestivibacter sp.]MCI6274466.1 hypothetical protein [Coriobacteriaceae bacterium]MCI6548754.1 hypothetical protein [Coriobacteriaceae bacterium]MCI6843728.1 hypothetical protein [Coriobacteriaceae bacterium]MCI7438980.1 hypothetical protein [Coriobacteriaceae bacterium]MDD7585349.1 hypothetical protein [Coriobacteriaceae bacterium]
MTETNKATGAAAGHGVMPDAADGADAFSELSDMFAEEDEKLRKSESNVLGQNLSGFASCFPDWSLHPPVD